MYIKTLSIQNFRNFESIHILFDKGFHTVIGANNIGKSNILYAIRLVLDQKLPNYYRKLKKEDIHNLNDVTINTYIKIAIEFGGSDLMELPNFPLIRTSDNSAEISYFFAHKSKLYSNYSNDEVLFERDFSWQLFGGKDIEIDDLINASPIPQSELEGISINLITDFRDIFKHLSSKRNTLFRDYLKSRPTYEGDKDILESVLESASIDLNDKPFIGEITTEITQKNTDITSEFFSQAYLIDFDSISDTDLWDSISIYFKVNGSKLPVTKLGLGQKNILFLALYILYLENNETGNVLNVLLIEEPEAHLHPQLQKLLFRKLRSMSKTQAIMTSHSAQIASDVEYKNMAVIYKRAGVVKSFTPFIETNLDDTTEKLLKRYFDVTRSELFFAEKVILVEGVTEKFILDSIMKIKYEYDLLENNISIVPIHGRHFHSFLPFFNKGGLEIEVSVLMDGDEQNEDDADFVTPAKAYERSSEGRIKVFNSDKTLEIELFPSRDINTVYLESIFRKLGHEQSHRNLINTTTDWDNELIRRVKSTISKGRFAQQLSLEIDDNFIVPDYIDRLAKHLKGDENV